MKGFRPACRQARMEQPLHVIPVLFYLENSDADAGPVLNELSRRFDSRGIVGVEVYSAPILRRQWF
jgi:hypothetical protein